MTFGAVVQARMGSTRLPGKVLKPIQDLPMIAYIPKRLQQSKYVTKVCFSSSLDELDKAIEEFSKESDYEYSKGPLDDIVGRLISSGEKLGTDFIVRIWGDSPLICYDIVDELIEKMMADNTIYGSTFFDSNTFIGGTNFEIYSMNLLREIKSKGASEFFLEFPFEYVKKHVDLNLVSHLSDERELSKYMLAVDYEEDFSNLLELNKKYDLLNSCLTYNELKNIALKEETYFLSNLERNIEYNKKKEDFNE